MITVPTHPPTQELLVPLRPELPPLPRRLSPRRAPRTGVATAIAWSVLAIVALAYAIAQILTGGVL